MDERPRLTTYAIRLSTGDHSGTPIVVPGSRSNVICLAAPLPSALVTHRLPCPPLSDRYTTSVPSGLTEGVCTCPLCRVTRIAVRVFSAGDPPRGNLQMSDCPRILDASTLPETWTSGSTNETSPKVSARSPVPSRLTRRKLNVDGYGTVLPADEL